MHGKNLQILLCIVLTKFRLHALLRLAIAHGSTMLRNATHANQTALTVALQALLTCPTLELFPSIAEHIFDVAVVLSDHISDDARIQVAALDSVKVMNSPRSHFITGSAAPVDGWLVLTKPVTLPLHPQVSSQPSTPATVHSQPSPYQSPQPTPSMPATPQQRYFSQQQQQRQQMQHAQQAQQMRSYPQYPQHPMQSGRQLPAQLQRTPSYQNSPSPLQQMQQIQQMQSLAQQRATQPSPVHSQRSTPAASQGNMGGPVGGASLSKMQTTFANQQREVRQYPFVQPRWEILAESSGNPNLNETAINLSLFGARKV
jgi:mediator of RNA polymerase II transcription subunit 12